VSAGRFILPDKGPEGISFGVLSKVLDRMDDYLGFPLPTLIERANLLKLYYNTYITKRKLPGHDSIPELAFQKAAKLLEGFSGREISKMMLSLLNGVYGSTEMVVTEKLFDTIVRQKLKEHNEKDKMMVENVSCTS
jgi:ATPase family AAA domain-containing protein 3A/B